MEKHGFFVYYIRSRALVIIFALLSALVFAVMFHAYGLPPQASSYPILVCGAIGTVLAAVDVTRAIIRHRRMISCMQAIEKAKMSETESLLALLPQPWSAEEADWRAISEILSELMRKADETAGMKYDEMVDYYTVWAHQIKTPISSVTLALRDEDSDLSRRISEEMVKIEQYVDMVMAYLRLDSESTDYVFRSCRLDDVIRSSLRRFSTQFIRRKIGLVYEQTDAVVVTDEKWLAFVIEQILSNALKYTERGQIAVTVTETDGITSLSISDTGVGIGKDDLPRIFEKGYTGKNGREDKRASGIGLWLCARICRAMSCKISAESSPAAGTTITIEFPENKS